MKEFQAAKHKELDTWLENETVSAALRSGIPLKRIMKVRWVLTWKEPEPGSDLPRRAKARLVVVGFQDPDLTSLARDSPTLSLRSRLLFLAYVAAAKGQLEKGDIKNAFL